MSYEKGRFAVFDGTSSDYHKVLEPGGSIAGYTVTEITPAAVKLQGADKSQTLQLRIGDLMQRVGSAWQPAGQGELPEGTPDSAALATGGSSPEAAAAPSAAGEPNDILKRLMQQREQELK